MKIELNFKSGDEVLEAYETLKAVSKLGSALETLKNILRNSITGAIELSDEDINDPTLRLRVEFNNQWNDMVTMLDDPNSPEAKELVRRRHEAQHAAVKVQDNIIAVESSHPVAVLDRELIDRIVDDSINDAGKRIRLDTNMGSSPLVEAVVKTEDLLARTEEDMKQRLQARAEKEELVIASGYFNEEKMKSMSYDGLEDAFKLVSKGDLEKLAETTDLSIVKEFYGANYDTLSIGERLMAFETLQTLAQDTSKKNQGDTNVIQK